MLWTALAIFAGLFSAGHWLISDMTARELMERWGWIFVVWLLPTLLVWPGVWVLASDYRDPQANHGLLGHALTKRLSLFVEPVGELFKFTLTLVALIVIFRTALWYSYLPDDRGLTKEEFVSRHACEFIVKQNIETPSTYARIHSSQLVDNDFNPNILRKWTIEFDSQNYYGADIRRSAECTMASNENGSDYTMLSVKIDGVHVSWAIDLLQSTRYGEEKDQVLWDNWYFF